MIKFKVCPRCRGDLYLAEDVFGRYLSCFQCGYLKDVARPELASTPVRAVEKENRQEAA